MSDEFLSYHIKMIKMLENFSAKVGKEDNIKSESGNESLHEVSNDNEICHSEKSVKNSTFLHTCTCAHAHTNTHTHTHTRVLMEDIKPNRSFYCAKDSHHVQLTY
jgi:hypothetical protein